MLLASARPSAEVGACAFENEPTFPGFFWDPSCRQGMQGCLADGVNMECRFCGGGNYSVPCPPSSCHFPSIPCPEELSAPPNGATCTFTENVPTTPSFWDP